MREEATLHFLPFDHLLIYENCPFKAVDKTVLEIHISGASLFSALRRSRWGREEADA